MRKRMEVELGYRRETKEKPTRKLRLKFRPEANLNPKFLKER